MDRGHLIAIVVGSIIGLAIIWIVSSKVKEVIECFEKQQKVKKMFDRKFEGQFTSDPVTLREEMFKSIIEIQNRAEFSLENGVMGTQDTQRILYATEELKS